MFRMFTETNSARVKKILLQVQNERTIFRLDGP